MQRLNQSLPFYWHPVQTYGGLQENLLSVNFSLFSFLSFSLNPHAAFPSSFLPLRTFRAQSCSWASLWSEKIMQVVISVSSPTGSAGITWPQRYTWSPWTTCTYELFCICNFQKKNGRPLKGAYVYVVCCRALQVLMDLQAQKETWWVSKLGIKKGVDSKNPFHILSSLPLCHPFHLIKLFCQNIQIHYALTWKREAFYYLVFSQKA